MRTFNVSRKCVNFTNSNFQINSILNKTTKSLRRQFHIPTIASISPSRNQIKRSHDQHLIFRRSNFNSKFPIKCLFISTPNEIYHRNNCRNFSSQSSSLPTPNPGSVLIIADHNNKTLHESCAHLVCAVQQLKLSNLQVNLLVCGHNIQSVAEKASRLQGVNKVISIDNANYEHLLAERITSVVIELNSKHKFEYICSAATANGKNYIPRIAALLDCQPITDIINVIDQSTFKRPIYAGNAISTVKTSDSTKICTFRPTNFKRVEDGQNPQANIELFTPTSVSSSNSQRVEWVSDEISVTSRPTLTSAKTIISGGRGLKSADGFKMLEELCDVLPNSSIGASRAAVDAGFIGNDYQIGQTGKVVAPDLYIAIGISGAIQHIAGMKDSKCIVSINKDGEAPIFQISDYGLVGDLFKLVPELTQKLKK